MAMDVRMIDGLFVVCGRSAVKLKERFPEVELRLRGHERPTSVEHAGPVIAINPRTRHVYVDVERGAELIGHHAATTTASQARSSEIIAALVDEADVFKIDEWDDIRLEGSYARGYAITIFGDEPTPDTIVNAFAIGYAKGWRDFALSWLRENDAARRVEGPIVVDVDARIGRRVVAHVDRGGVVRKVVIRDTSPVAAKQQPIDRVYVDALLRWIDSCGFNMASGNWRVDPSPTSLDVTIHGSS